ncbi:hypothetical protein STEG23_034677 [Scotinomys teguina]
MKTRCRSYRMQRPTPQISLSVPYPHTCRYPCSSKDCARQNRLEANKQQQDITSPLFFRFLEKAVGPTREAFAVQRLIIIWAQCVQ